VSSLTNWYYIATGASYEHRMYQGVRLVESEYQWHGGGRRSSVYMDK